MMRSRWPWLIVPTTLLAAVALMLPVTVVSVGGLTLLTLAGIVRAAGQSCDAYIHATGTDATGLPKGPVSVQILDSHPESELVVPDASVVSHTANPETQPCFIHGRLHFAARHERAAR
jgi:hypothetical protein